MAFIYSIFCFASKNQIRCNVAKARLFLQINEQKHHIVKRFCMKIEMHMENYIRATKRLVFRIYKYKNISARTQR
jgi:hypothetical protein